MSDDVTRRAFALMIGLLVSGAAAARGQGRERPSGNPASKQVGNSAIRHSMVAVNGATLHVARVGKGRPLLLLHGWPEFWLTWEAVMMRLADRFELIAPDLRGFGDSDKPAGPFTAKQQADDMIALLDALGLERVGLVAHDVGGAVAQSLGQAAADRLAGLFFFSFLHPGIGDRFFATDRLENVWYMFFHEMPFAVDLVGASRDTIASYFTYFLKTWAYRTGAFDPVLDDFIDNFAKPGNIAGGFDYYRAAIPPRTNPKGAPPPPPPPIAIPTCVRWPTHDKLFDYGWTDTLPRFFTQLDLAPFPDAGHFPHREDPAKAAAEIGRFFGSLSDPRWRGSAK